MRRSTVAVLLSALASPGAGHLYLKHNGRGIALIVLSLACLGVIMAQAMQQASAVVDQLLAEGSPIDAGHIADLATQASNQSGSTLGTIATLVLGGCWVVGIVDAYRLGKRQDAPQP